MHDKERDVEKNVHKDFHGAMSFGIRFLEEHHGAQGRERFLRSLADSVYRPLVEDLRERGLPALEEHWRKIFTGEEGEFVLRYDGDALVLEVSKCPAIHHMQAHGYAIAETFCEHTRIVNEAVCAAAGYAASTEYDQDRGACTQRFWRAKA